MSKRERVTWMISILVVIGLLGATAYFSSKISAEWHQVIAIVALGVLSSSFATLVFSSFQKSAWQRDMKIIGENIEAVQGEVNALKEVLVELDSGIEDKGALLSEGLSAAEANYSALLERLPDALGGRFTESLWAYHPDSSPGIAKVLGGYARRAYSHHVMRTVVERGRDIYYLRGLATISWQEQGMSQTEGIEVWDLTFRIEWSWRNDSVADKNPLSTFAILITAPPQAIPRFPSRGPKGNVDAYRTVAEPYTNRVVVTVENPLRGQAHQPIPPSSLSSLDQLFDITSLEFTNGAGDLAIAVEDLQLHEEIDPAERPGIYKILRLPEEKENMGILRPGELLHGAYEGKMRVPSVRNGEGAIEGVIEYMASDIVEEDFSLVLNFPEEMDWEGVAYKVEADHDRSFCQDFQGEETVFSSGHKGSIDRVSERFQLNSSRKAQVVKVDKHLTNLHFLSVAWKAEAIGE